MFFPDLTSECQADAGPYVRAVGWLASAHPFVRGTVPPEFVSSLREHVAMRWQPVVAAGLFACEFCEREPARAGGNVWIPTRDVVYVAPELIAHYVEAHGYRPPDAFMQAVVSCPPQGSEDYFALMRRFPGWWAGSLPP